MPPSIWPLAVAGLMAMPQSTAITSFFTVTWPVSSVHLDLGELAAEGRRRVIAHVAGGRHDLVLVLGVRGEQRHLLQRQLAAIRRNRLAVAQHDG